MVFSFEERGEHKVREVTVLVCVRTSLAAGTVASCAERLGVAAAVRTAVSAAEAMARLAEQPADVVLADTALTRPDSVAFTRRVLAHAPHATLVLFGPENRQVAAAAVAAGARGVIRGTDQDLVSVVAKALLLVLPAGTPAPTAPGTATGASGPGLPGFRAGVPVSRPGAPSSHPGVAASQPGELDPHAGRPANGGPANRGPGPHPGGPANGGPGSHPGRADVAGWASGPGGPGGPGAPAGPAGPGAPDGSGGAGGPDGTGGAPITVVPVQRSDLPRGYPGSPPHNGYQGGLPPGAPSRRTSLTERELQVLRGMADGKSNAEIGRELFVSEDTVKTHARRLFRKLGARDRAHAVAAGFRAGLVA
jgi:DNA-binding NarL/FixJ family response regulator